MLHCWLVCLWSRISSYILKGQLLNNMLLTKADKEHEEYVWSIVGWYVHGLVYLDSPAPSPSDIPNLK